MRLEARSSLECTVMLHHSIIMRGNLSIFTSVFVRKESEFLNNVLKKGKHCITNEGGMVYNKIVDKESHG